MNRTLLTVSQVFIGITGVLLLIYGFLFMVLFGMISPELPLNIVTVILFALAVLYIIIFIRMQQAKSVPEMKTEIIIWSVLLLITSNIFSGIFGLIGALSESSNQSGSGEQSLESRLKDLDSLFDRGLITLEEYHDRRKRIIETY